MRALVFSYWALYIVKRALIIELQVNEVMSERVNYTIMRTKPPFINTIEINDFLDASFNLLEPFCKV